MQWGSSRPCGPLPCLARLGRYDGRRAVRVAELCRRRVSSGGARVVDQDMRPGSLRKRTMRSGRHCSVGSNNQEGSSSHRRGLARRAVMRCLAAVDGRWRPEGQQRGGSGAPKLGPQELQDGKRLSANSASNSVLEKIWKDECGTISRWRSRRGCSRCKKRKGGRWRWQELWKRPERSRSVGEWSWREGRRGTGWGPAWWWMRATKPLSPRSGRLVSAWMSSNTSSGRRRLGRRPKDQGWWCGPPRCRGGGPGGETSRSQRRWAPENGRRGGLADRDRAEKRWKAKEGTWNCESRMGAELLALAAFLAVAVSIKAARRLTSGGNTCLACVREARWVGRRRVKRVRRNSGHAVGGRPPREAVCCRVLPLGGRGRAKRKLSHGVEGQRVKAKRRARLAVVLAAMVLGALWTVGEHGYCDTRSAVSSIRCERGGQPNMGSRTGNGHESIPGARVRPFVGGWWCITWGACGAPA